jgi:hypothetical protein
LIDVAWHASVHGNRADVDVSVMDQPSLVVGGWITAATRSSRKG